MVYLDDYEEFQAAAQELFISQPLRTRYVVKYRHSQPKVILKVTDNKVCLKYRSDMLADLKKVERFSQAFARWTSAQRLDNLGEPDVELEEAKSSAKPKAKNKARRKG
eukprot:TRINITY_DN76638_c0_g1_i1.p2 TRINITY_DN76638_c0_g1~~TRINITY_DN76638_c0_g1_i1.p2  ORF type:complete len:108 (+),score=27.50 TRINITY_DN76638_c0_g1_i1:82-405(+)